jgi:hypothetical protein
MALDHISPTIMITRRSIFLLASSLAAGCIGCQMQTDNLVVCDTNGLHPTDLNGQTLSATIILTKAALATFDSSIQKGQTSESIPSADGPAWLAVVVSFGRTRYLK